MKNTALTHDQTSLAIKGRLITFLTGIVLTACDTMYIPNAQSTPVFKGKHDVIVNGSYSNYQMAYAPTNYIGIMVNGYYRNVKYPDIGKSNGAIDHRGSAKGLEAGVGLYKQFQNISFGIYGGWGKGYCSITESSRLYAYYTKSDAHYMRSFVQPTFSFGNERIVGILSTRVSFMNFYEIDPVLVRQGKPFFVEPSITMQLRLGKIYFHNQFQLSVVDPEESDYVYGFSPVINIGFAVHLKDLCHPKATLTK